MLLCIYIILILFGVICHKKKNKSVYDIVIMAFLGLMLYVAENQRDYNAYMAVYNHIGSGTKYFDTGVGWYYLCKIGNIFCLNYKQFQLVVLFVSLLLIRNTINYYVKNSTHNYLWTFYLVFPAILDCVQIRFLLAESIVIFGFKFFDNKSYKKSALFFICVFFGFIVHSSCAMYFILLLAPVFGRIKKALFGVVVVLSLMVLMGKSLIVQFAALFINGARVERYLNSDNGASALGLIGYLGTLFIFTSVIDACKKKYIHNVDDAEGVVLLDNIYIVNMLLWILVPLSMIDTDIFRLYRIVWVLSYLVFVMLIDKGCKRINLFGKICVSVKTIGCLIALFGLIVYVWFFSFSVFKVFLLRV